MVLLGIILFVILIIKVLLVKNHSPFDLIKPIVAEIPCRWELSVNDNFRSKTIKGVRIYCYQNLPAQTDDTPNITRTGRMVYSGSLAVSQDLWNKEIKAGDLVFVELTKKWYVAEDTMHQRHNKSIDIFGFDNLNINGKSDILVVRVEK